MSERAAYIADRLEPIMDLLTDETVTEVQVRRGGSHILVQRDGILRLLPERTFPGLTEAIYGIAGSVGKDVPAAYPVVNLRLDDYGARVAAMLPPLARGGAMMTIRLFPKRYTLAELVCAKMLTYAEAARLRDDVYDCRTILISGAGGSGKTTLLGALLGILPCDQPVCIIEEEGELVSDNPFVTQMETLEMVETFDPTRPSRPRIGIDALVRDALRHSPGRIVIGEVRGLEAADMLRGANTGHPGGLTTIHANSASDALDRLAQLASLQGSSFSYAQAQYVVRQVVHGVVHLANVGGHRQVVEYRTVKEAA